MAQPKLVLFDIDETLVHTGGAGARWAWAFDQLYGIPADIGTHTAYDQVPYFYSDQYEMGMEYCGYVANGTYDEVVFRGDLDKSEYIAFWLREGRCWPA
jgi:FMN phosphatase YigB (HAD superfamily)